MPPSASIRGSNPSRLRYDDLDGATVSVALRDARFDPSASAADFELLGGPLGVSIERAAVQSANLVTLALRYLGPVLTTRHAFAVRILPSAVEGALAAPVESRDRVRVTPDPDPWSAPVLAVYLLAVAVAALLAAISQWSDVRALTDNDAETVAALRPNVLLGLDWRLGGEELVLIFVASVGVFFAALAGLRTAATYVGRDGFDDRWWLWYLIRPLLGAGMAIGSFWVLRAALLGEGSALQDLNTFGLASIAAVAGLFSRSLIEGLPISRARPPAG